MLQSDPGFDLRETASSVASNDTPNFSLIGPTASELRNRGVHVRTCGNVTPEFDLRDIASSVVSNDIQNFSLIGPTVSEL